MVFPRKTWLMIGTFLALFLSSFALLSQLKKYWSGYHTSPLPKVKTKIDVQIFLPASSDTGGKKTSAWSYLLACLLTDLLQTHTHSHSFFLLQFKSLCDWFLSTDGDRTDFSNSWENTYSCLSSFSPHFNSFFCHRNPVWVTACVRNAIIFYQLMCARSLIYI